MNRSHKIRLCPNNKQTTFFKKACGVGRFTYNWALAEWNRQYENGEKPSANNLRKQFNQIRKENFPWMSETHRDAYSQQFANLNRAFQMFFNKTGKYPKFKKKGTKDSFYISNDRLEVNGAFIKIPKLGWVKMREPLRFSGKIMSATISRTADMWFVSISVQLPEIICENQAYLPVGIDLGISALATLSDGIVFENIRTTQKYERKLRRLNKSLARKEKGSENWKKAKIKLSKLHYKIKCIRQDYLHKMTSYLSKNYSDICMEDLNVDGMIKNHKLAKALSDVSFGEIKRQILYKCVNVHFVDRFFPSTKLCDNCGQLHDMPLHKRVFTCDCGIEPIDRDLHAAQNILREMVRQGLPEPVI